MARFEGKKVIITGASKASGVGAATAALFVNEGASVVLLDMDKKSGAALQEKLGETALFHQCDVSDETSVKTAFGMAAEFLGGIDCLINNAAVLAYTPVHKTSLEEWNRIMGVNTTGPFLCAKYAIPHMLEQKEGSIVNVGSAQSFMSQQNVAPYVTSKHALLGLTRSIAVDYAPVLRCNLVAPSTIDTPMLHWALEQNPNPSAMMTEVVDMHLLKRIANPGEIASLIAFLCSKDAANITGQAFRSDGGIGILIEGSNDSSVN